VKQPTVEQCLSLFYRLTSSPSRPALTDDDLAAFAWLVNDHLERVKAGQLAARAAEPERELEAFAIFREAAKKAGFT
jgi:hypothetical protein